MPAVRELLAAEFDGALAPGDVELVPARFLDAPDAAVRQREGAMGLEFGMQIGAFPDGVASLGATARAAEEAGFASVSVMDHLVQIPQIAAMWNDVPEGWTSVGYLAAATSRVRIGTLVTNVLLRNPALLAKMVATVDVLSGGRVFCALGAGWFDRELQTYGYGRLPSAAERLDRLEEALQLLPRYWGPGEPTCYPRPVQERVPILVGGNGERRTLRLVAQYADGCNLQGEPDVVAAKVAVLHRHCEDVGRDPATVRVTHLSEAGVIDPGEERYADVVGTVEEQVGRYRALAEAGVHECFVGVYGPPETFAPVIDAFR
jgi:alkanesulfonate monooxygenase SsuD/methylene tetrahydromethanopterin reductase-like flavin-dependent oxidoreductase (luciferase family)